MRDEHETVLNNVLHQIYMHNDHQLQNVMYIKMRITTRVWDNYVGTL